MSLGSKSIYCIGSKLFACLWLLPSFLAKALKAAKLAVKIDDSTGSIGRRYARTDELSVPFAVTIDFDTLEETPASVTLRERDTTEQVRIPVSVEFGLCVL